MVDSRLDGRSQMKLSAWANGGQNPELPIAYWVRAVATIAAKNKLAELEPGSKHQLPEDFSASDFDVVRARALSSQI
jgi:hypothetical protein